jgi:hypothetical protein
MTDRFAVAPLFVIGALITLPVLIVGGLARWRYPGSDAIVGAEPAGQIG